MTAAKHPGGCDLRSDGTPYHERTCAGCACRITFTGDVALILHAEARGPTWCDETCRRGSGVRMRWEPMLWHEDERVMRREVAARRVAVQEGRR